jgi:hypothetical protein
MHIGFWWESQKVKRPPGIPTRRREDNIEMDLRELGGVVQTGLIWLRIGTGEELL